MVEVNPYYMAVALDETGSFDLAAEDLEFVKAILGIYVFDKNEFTEGDTSHFLRFVEYVVRFEEGTPEDRYNALYEEFGLDNWGEDRHVLVEEVQCGVDMADLSDIKDATVDDLVESLRDESIF